MALCLVDTGSGLLVASPQPADLSQCAIVALNGADVGLLSFNALFAMPTTSALQAAFMAGISAPLTCYLVAHFVGLLVHFFKD